MLVDVLGGIRTARIEVSSYGDLSHEAFGREDYDKADSRYRQRVYFVGGENTKPVGVLGDDLIGFGIELEVDAAHEEAKEEDKERKEMVALEYLTATPEGSRLLEEKGIDEALRESFR
ncbi:hypothetical protein CL618_02295 [archaeon]|nr:hypothetical protein [archaeon]|tara:strand:- start:4398 stop:4751 length:354 start_codon:yes stop_codon:yes gene_type:complete